MAILIQLSVFKVVIVKFVSFTAESTFFYFVIFRKKDNELIPELKVINQGLPRGSY